MTEINRFLVVNITAAIKAIVTRQAMTPGFALVPALMMPVASVNFGAKESRFSAMIDITLAPAAPAPPTFEWLTLSSPGAEPCTSVSANTVAMAAANSRGPVCMAQNGSYPNFMRFTGALRAPGRSLVFWCAREWPTGKISCRRRYSEARDSAAFVRLMRGGQWINRTGTGFWVQPASFAGALHAPWVGVNIGMLDQIRDSHAFTVLRVLNGAAHNAPDASQQGRCAVPSAPKTRGRK